jgi:hypothetical protein
MAFARRLGGSLKLRLRSDPLAQSPDHPYLAFNGDVDAS